MSSDDEKEAIKLQLLGIQAADAIGDEHEASDDLADQREKVRNEILARRKLYLSSKRTQPIYTLKRRRWGTLPVVLVALVGLAASAGLALQNATATHARQNQAYAIHMLDSAERFDLQDLAVLNATAAAAEDKLPDASLLGLAGDDWDRLFTASRAARSLFTARMGNVELAIQQIERTRKLADSLADQGQASEARLVSNLCLGKAGQSVCELLADTGNYHRAYPFAETTIKALEDAYAGLAKSQEITPENHSILAASLQLDLARLRSRGINPPGTTIDEAHAAIEIHASLAREHLQNVRERDAGWWNQKLRLDGHDLLMRERTVRSRRIESDEIRGLLASVVEVESAIAAVSTTSPEFSTALTFQSAIYISNLVDLLESSLKDDQLDEFGPKLISLRGQAISKLLSVPVYDRTHLHHTNLTINFARRMELNCLMAVYRERQGDSPREHLAAAKLDAQALEASTGNLLRGKSPQLSTARQMLAAVLLDRASDEQIELYAARYPMEPEQRTLMDTVKKLARQ